MLDEIIRVLKPYGELLIRNDAYFHGILEKLRVLPGRIGGNPDPTHVNMMTPKELYSILDKNGFNILKKYYLPLWKYSEYLNRDIFSPFAIKGQFLCRKL